VVWRVAWAHPEFGQLLATAGADTVVHVWEEQEGGFDNRDPTPVRELQLQRRGGGASGGGAAAEAAAAAVDPSAPAAPTHSRWVQKAQLTEARKSVNCLAFAPRHGGLRLAAGSADGVVRIYEAIDVMNLNHWPMSQFFEADVRDSEVRERSGRAKRAGGRAKRASGRSERAGEASERAK
jgi:nucleoporin SEH1